MLLCAFSLALLLFNPPLFFILGFFYFVFLVLVELAVPLFVLACIATFYYHCWNALVTYLEKWVCIADYSRLASVVDLDPTLTTKSLVCSRSVGASVSSRVVVSRGVVAVSCPGVALSRGVVSGSVAVSGGAVAVSGGAVVSRGVALSGGVDIAASVVESEVPGGDDRGSFSLGDVVEVAVVPAGVLALGEGDGSVPGDVAAAAIDAVPVPAPAAVVPPDVDVAVDDDDNSVDDELAFLFAHLTVEDPLDEDVYMAPPFDWRFVEPVDMMEIEDDLLSIMSCHLDSSPFVDVDEDVPIDVDMPLVDIPPEPATPPPPSPPSPTPIPMEVDLTLLSPDTNPHRITTPATTNTINTAINAMPDMPPTITSTATSPTTSIRHPTREDTPPPPPMRHNHTTTTTTNSATHAITIPRIEIRPSNFLGTTFVRAIPAPTTSATTTTSIRHPSAPSPRPQPRGALQQALPQPTMRPEAAAELAHLLRELGAVAEEEEDDDDEQ